MKKVMLAVSLTALVSTAGQAVSVQMKMKQFRVPDASEWKLLGTGSMIDAWVTPGLKYPQGDIDYTKYPFEVQIYESTTTPGIYRVESPWTSDKYPFKDYNKNTEPHDIIIDATNPSFVRIEPQVSGFVHASEAHSSNYTDPFYISTKGDYFYADGNSIEDIIDYGFNSTKEDDVITILADFGKKPTDMGYSWSSFPGAKSIITLPGDQPVAQWVEKGELTFIDGFICPGYFGDPTSRSWKVTYEELEGSEGMYRIVNPYLADGCPLKPVNLNTENTWVIIDATDPDIVLIAPQYSGFTGTVEEAPYTFYIGNDAGDLTANQLWSTADIKEYLPQRTDKMVNGIITINQPLFGSNSTAGFGVQWTGADDKPLVYPARFIFPWAVVEPEEPEEPRVRTFYEGFEDYKEEYGLDWYPQVWTRISTPENTPTQEQLSHNVNNTWYAYYSSNIFQDPTPDGEVEMFVHFGYDGDWCKASEQDEWLISPEIQLNETETETLRWLLQAEPFSVYDWINDFDFKTFTFTKRTVVNNFEVLVTTDNGANWESIWNYADAVASKLNDAEVYNAGNISYNAYHVELPDYVGKKVMFGFRYTRDADSGCGNSMMLDRIVVDHPITAAIEAVEAVEESPVEYFNLNGVKVSPDTAVPGIYIERRGSATRKIVIR